MISLIDHDGTLTLIKGFVQNKALFDRLLNELAWQEEKIILMGREISVPRRVCWYGDEKAVYRYSGLSHQPLPWHPALLDIKSQIEAVCDRRFNSVLGNLYRNGQDSMGWHSDSEKELGKNPFIASLSLGDERLFKICHKKTQKIQDINLADGDLLMMGGEFQHHYRHCLPKTRQLKSARINLTFRKILI